MQNENVIRLEHGSGGALSRELIDQVVFPFFQGQMYAGLTDATEFAVSGTALVTTDSYVVDPPFFPGGDIGSLSVKGTCNDLAVSGGKPLYLTLGMILEEGFPVADLRKLLKSIVTSADEIGVKVLSGDTKVVPSGKGGGIFLNTAGIGKRIFAHSLSPKNIRSGDVIIISGPIGSHGIAVLAARENLPVGANITSDVAHLFPLCEGLVPLKESIRFLRDVTRGGAAAVLNEIVQGRAFGAEVREEDFVVSPQVSVTADLLGLNPLEIANEGVLVAVVAPEAAARTLAILASLSLGESAVAVGTITDADPGKVLLETRVGGRRVLDFPRGLLLPRIC